MAGRQLATLFCVAAMLRAQGGSGTLAGTIEDPAAKAVEDAQVTIVSEATGTPLVLRTNASGQYQSPPLAPGAYRVEVSMTGFRRLELPVSLEADQRLIADFTLVLGERSEQITVGSKTPVLELEQASIHHVEPGEEISALPIDVRNFGLLLTLFPGTVPFFSNTAGALLGTNKRGVTSVGVNGIRPMNDWNNIKIEGIDDAENHNGFGVAVMPAMESIEEVSIQTSAADAEYGSAAGGFVNIVLKSGTREIHGSLYEFARNSAFDAKNFFDSATAPIPHFVFHQFGGTLGGPIPRVIGGRTFFFVSVEGDIRRQGLTLLSTVPTVAMKSGDFRGAPTTVFDPLSGQPGPGGTIVRQPFPGNLIPVSRMSTAGRNIAALYPNPNMGGLASNFLSNPISRYGSHQVDFKIDQMFERDALSLRGSAGNTTIFSPPALPAPGGDGSNTNVSGSYFAPVRQGAVTERHTFSSTTGNELRSSFTRLALTLHNINYGANLAAESGIPGVNTGSALSSGLPVFSPTGYSSLGDSPTTPAVIVTNNYQVSDMAFFLRGRHSLRAGGQVLRRQLDVFQTSSERGSYAFTGGFTANPASPAGTGSGIADLLLGYPASGQIQLLDGTRGFRRTDLAGFVQDDWRASARLAVNLGLRYEVYAGYPWTEVAGRQEQFLFASASLAPVSTAGIPASGVRADRNNWAPRAGLVYALTPATVLRAAYAIFYAAPLIDISRNLAVNPPFAGTWSFANNQLAPAAAWTLDEGFQRTSQLTGVALNALDAHMRTPYVQQWNASVQHEVARGTAVTMAYVATKGTKLRDQYNVNQAVPGPGSVAARRPWPLYNDIQYTANSGNSIYHSLQVSLDKRLSKGLTSRVSYTWSHAIDDASLLGGQHQNSLLLSADRGNSDTDLRHLFLATLVYTLPRAGGPSAIQRITGGWEVSGVLRLSSGLPFSLISAVNTLNGSGTQRPSVIAGCDPVLRDAGPARWFNTLCFATPAPFTFGNAGRNVLEGAGTKQLDFSLLRAFPLGGNDKRRLELRADAFNISNTPQFDNPVNTIGAPGAGQIQAAGSPASFQRTSRQVQLGARVTF